MKKILLLFSTLLFAFNLSAQNYDSDYYLRQAYSALEEGKIEVAQSSYNIYTKMTGRTDLDFETLLKDADINAWKKSCYIIKVNDTLSLAVQRIDKHQIPVSYHVAKVKAQASRLGNFTDWRLPDKSELYIILPNISFHENEVYYWIKGTGTFKLTTSTSGTGRLETKASYYAMSNMSFKVVETYFEHKIDNYISETRGNKDICHNFLTIRSFNPNKNK